jgi:hypothetical protein
MAGSRSKVLSHAEVRLSDAPIRVGESSQTQALEQTQSRLQSDHVHETSISLDHDQHGNVAVIHIRCQCGEDITISCDYPDAA